MDEFIDSYDGFCVGDKVKIVNCSDRILSNYLRSHKNIFTINAIEEFEEDVLFSFEECNVVCIIEQLEHIKSGTIKIINWCKK